MTAVTYTSLKTDISAYLERGFSEASDPAVFAQIPRLIALAENRIATELKILGFKAVVTTTLTPGVDASKTGQVARDDQYQFWYGVSFEERKSLFPRSYEYAVAAWPDRTETGEPECYSDYNVSHWFFAPTPEQAYPIEISYYEKLELLSDTAETNWLTETYPQLLLYAVMWETALFLKDSQRAVEWQALYDRAAALINGEDLSRIFDRNTVRKKA